jgi:hypothetical protein
MPSPASHILAALVLLAPATFAATTQPSQITLRATQTPLPALLDQFAKQAGAPLPLTSPELAQKAPPVTLTVDRQPFWKALHAFSRATGLEPFVNPEDPYPRFQLAPGNGFWQSPHAVAGPVLIIANDVQRSSSVELRKRDGEFERTVTVNLTAFAEPGLRLLAVSDEVRVREAVDSKGRRLNPFSAPEDAADGNEPPDMGGPGNGLYTWPLSVTLDCPTDAAPSVTRLKGSTRVRVQTASEKVEFDDVMKIRGVTKSVVGLPFTFQSLKKADVEYILRLGLRREKKSEIDWRNLHGSIYNGHMALYDDKGRLVAARATENGGDYAANRIDATLRFVREAGVSDPAAGEPFKLVWLAPTQSTDLPVEFELNDLPIPD